MIKNFETALLVYCGSLCNYKAYITAREDNLSSMHRLAR